jgi:KaiC/GvpD/RAD55 family RecA-like ATPase
MDGKPTTANEWSDASKISLSLRCGIAGLDWIYCGWEGATAPVEPLDVVVWAKHDGSWLYLLYQIPQITYQYRSGPEVWINYCFSGTGKAPWTGCDLGSLYLNLTDRSNYVNDEYFYRGRTGGNDVTKFGGQRNAIGAATFDDRYYWFELRKMLNSGDGADWVMLPSKTYGIWGVDGLITLSFGDGEDPRWGEYVSLSLCPCAETASVTTMTIEFTTSSPTTASTDAYTSSAFSTQTVVAPSFYAQLPLGPIEVLAVVFVLASLTSTLLVLRRRKHAPTATVETQAKAQQITKAVQPPKPYVSTGYEDLDGSLEGGIPHGYAVVLVSPSYDERDLLLRRTIDSSLSSGMPVYYVSNDMAKTQDLILRYPNGFYAFCSHADKIPSHGPNLFKIPGIENLSDANLSLTLALRDARAKESATKSLLIIDILSDVLLRHKALVARRWVTDFVSKRKTEGFTILATLNPLTGTKEETQAVVDFFDGIIEIYEKSLLERARRFLIVRKMFGRRYSQAEIMLEIERLW